MNFIIFKLKPYIQNIFLYREKIDKLDVPSKILLEHECVF